MSSVTLNTPLTVEYSGDVLRDKDESNPLAAEFCELLKDGVVFDTPRARQTIIDTLMSMPEMNVHPRRFSASDICTLAVHMALDQHCGAGLRDLSWSPISVDGANCYQSASGLDAFASRQFEGVHEGHASWRAELLRLGLKRYRTPQLRRTTFNMQHGRLISSQHSRDRVAQFGIASPEALFVDQVRTVNVNDAVLRDASRSVTIETVPCLVHFRSTRSGTMMVEAAGRSGSVYDAVVDCRPLFEDEDTMHITTESTAVRMITLISSGNGRVGSSAAMIALMARLSDLAPEAPFSPEEDDFSLFEGSSGRGTDNGLDLPTAIKFIRAVKVIPQPLWYLSTWTGMRCPLVYEQAKENDIRSRDPFLLDQDSRVRISGFKLHHARSIVDLIRRFPGCSAASVSATFLGLVVGVLRDLDVRATQRDVVAHMMEAVKRVPLSNYFFHTRDTTSKYAELLTSHIMKLTMSPTHTRCSNHGSPMTGPTYALLNSLLPEQLAAFEYFKCSSPCLGAMFKAFKYEAWGEGRLDKIRRTAVFDMLSDLSKLTERAVNRHSDISRLNAFSRAYIEFPHYRSGAPITDVRADDPAESNLVDASELDRRGRVVVYRAIRDDMRNPSHQAIPIIVRLGPMISLLWRHEIALPDDKISIEYICLSTTFQKTGLLPNDGNNKYYTHGTLAGLHGRGGLYDVFLAKLRDSSST